MEEARITECIEEDTTKRITERITPHCAYVIKYHIIWITKHRKPVLNGNIAKRAEELIQMICRENDVDIIAGHVGEYHIHLLVKVPAHLTVRELVQQLKEETSRKLQTEYRGLKKQCWGRELWSGGSFVVSSGKVKREAIAKYIKVKG